MNQKIYDLIRNSGAMLKKAYKAFASDEYGTWTNTLTGNGGCSAVGEGVIWGMHNYAGNGVSYRGNAYSKRTVDSLCKADEINFETWYERQGNNVWSWWAYDFIIKIADKIVFNKSGIYVNNKLLCAFSENNHHKISIRQRKIIVDDITYLYQDGFKLADANDNLFSTETCAIDVNAGGYGCHGVLYLHMSNIEIKQIK